MGKCMVLDVPIMITTRILCSTVVGTLPSLDMHKRKTPSWLQTLSLPLEHMERSGSQTLLESSRVSVSSNVSAMSHSRHSYSECLGNVLK